MTKIPTPAVLPVTQPPSSTSTAFYCLAANGYWYFDPTRETSCPPAIYGELVAHASKTVSVWDPWVLEQDAAVFGAIKGGVHLRVLTDASATAHAARYVTFTQAIANVNKQVRVEIRCANREVFPNFDGAFSFHDRYLIADDVVYAVGSSLAYHRQRCGATAILRIDDADARAIVTSAFDRYWDWNATQKTKTPFMYHFP